VEKYCTADQATDDYGASALYACWIPKATNSHLEHVLLLLLLLIIIIIIIIIITLSHKNGCMIAPNIALYVLCQSRYFTVLTYDTSITICMYLQ
jgi:hypothetical protein